MSVGDVLLISGLPGAGKTTFTDWLVGHDWGCLRSDDIGTLDPEQRLAFQQVCLGNDEPLLILASRYPAGFVFEWGFPGGNIDLVEAVIGRGYNAWYFDGDWDAARQGWTSRWPRRPVEEWWAQARSLQRVAARIRDIYGTRILRTVESIPSYPWTPAELHQMIGLPPVNE
jgi:hypothetical protein